MDSQNSKEQEISSTQTKESNKEAPKEIHKANTEKQALSSRFKEWFKATFSDKYNLLFLVILSVGILLRLKYIGQESIWNDAAVHLWYAQKVLKEPLFMFSREYILGDYFTVQTATAILKIFTNNVVLAGKIVAMIFSVVGIIFMYLLGSELKNKKWGLLAATLLASNHLYLFYGVRLLADAPLLSMIIVSTYCTVKLEKEQSTKWGILTVISFLGLLLTKGQGILLFLAYLGYLLLSKRKKFFTQRAYLIIWAVPISLIILGSTILQYNFASSLISRIFGGSGLEYHGLNALKMLPWISTWYLLAPAIVGMIFVLLYKEKSYYFILSSLLVYMAFFEYSVGTPEDRYILPMLPFIILFGIYGIQEIVEIISCVLNPKKHKETIVLVATSIIVLLIAVAFLQTGGPLVEGKTSSYSGLTEAGQWITENVGQQDIVFAGSPRMLRAFSGREYAGPGEWSLGGESLIYFRDERYTSNKNAFIEDAIQFSSQGKEVFIVVDVWEYTQAPWYFPLTNENLNQFVELGFEPVKIIQREVSTTQGIVNTGVVFIFKLTEASKLLIE